jgi:hypothetical protein
MVQAAMAAQWALMMQQHVVPVTSTAADAAAGANEPPRGLDRYAVREMHFHESNDPTAEVTYCDRLNTRVQLFGFENLRTVLGANVLGPERFPALFRGDMHRPCHFSHIFAPDGSGIRTFVTNWCRETSFNMLWMPRDPNDPDSTRYDTGTYTQLLERALQMQPCVVLVDRLDGHWDAPEGRQEQYERSGAELFRAWHAHLERHAWKPPEQPRPPAVWFVISTQRYWASLAEGFKAATRDSWATMTAIAEHDYDVILRDAFAKAMRQKGFVDDRPLDDAIRLQLAPAEASPEFAQDVLERRAASTFEAMLESHDELLKRATRTILQMARERHVQYLRPTLVCEICRVAFARARERAINPVLERAYIAPRPAGTAGEMRDLEPESVPTDKDFGDAASAVLV